MATRFGNPGHPPGTTVMDRNGDVLFELGGGELTAHLLVSSKVLSLASSVFSAMFTHGFSEGQGLSSNSPRVIPLPDDDPPAMTLLCRILHFCTSVIPTELDVAALAELAILCDKYDCAGPVKPWGLVWMAELLPFAGETGFEKLLFATYGLDLPEAFHKVTKALIETHLGLLEFKDSPGYEILPDGLTEMIKHEQQEMRSQLAHAFDAAINPMVMLSNRPCMAKFVGQFYYNLLAVGLWPLSEKLAVTPFSEIRTLTAKLTPPVLTFCNVYGCHCSSGGSALTTGLAPKLIQSIANVVTSAKGLCLDCAKSGGRPADNRECRVPHKTSTSTPSGL